MPPQNRFIGLIFDMGHVVLTDFDDDGHLRAQVDAYGEQQSGVEPYELHHTFGFMSRPIDPEVDVDALVRPGLACNLLTASEGNAQHAWLGLDPRYIPFLPALKKGTSVVYGGKRPSSAAFGHIDEDGTWTKYIPVEVDANGAPTKAHVLTLGIDDNGKPHVTLAHADGMAVTMLDEKIQLRNTNGEVYIELTDKEFVVNGNTKLNGGLIAGDVLLAQPLVLHPVLVAAITTLVANINAALATKEPIPGVTPVPVIIPPELAAALTKFIKGL